MTTIELTGNGAIYKRVSTDKQDAERQTTSTAEWLDRHHQTVNPEHIYTDIGWARADARKRPDFNRLLQDAEDGLIQWVGVDRHDRFECKDKMELFAYLHRFREAGCRVYTCDDKELTSIETVEALQTFLASDNSEKELREKSLRVLEGKRHRATTGQWLGGKVAYGCDVVAVALDANGNMHERWRVIVMPNDIKIKIDHTAKSRREYTHWPASESDEILQLRPTLEKDRLEVVQRIYDAYQQQHTNPGTIARQLMAEGVTPPPYSDRWRHHHIEEILRNPVYIGRPAWNRHSSSKYTEFVDGRREQREPGQKRARRHKQSDWITADELLFDPIISPKQWQAVQAKIASRKDRPRATRSTGYTLSGLVYCANCGGKAPMVGGRMPSKKLKPADRKLTYLCGTYQRWTGPRPQCPCKAFRVDQSLLEETLREYLDETLPLVGGVTAAVTARKPPAMEEALKRANEAFTRMVDRIGGELIVHDGVKCIAYSGGLADMEMVPVQYYADLFPLYRRIFDSEKHQLQAQLDQLEAEHTSAVKAWRDLPTERAKEKAKREIAELEAQMEELEGKLKNAADDMAEAVRTFTRTQQSWDGATKAMSTERQHRARAEALRKVIGRINVTFRETGRNWPVGEVASIEVVPVDGFTQSGSGHRC